jgi:ubiquinone/menaquinone biosynthesis C-methylase UbiE
MSQPPESLSHAARIARLFDAVSSVYDGVGVDFFQPIAEGLLEAMPPREGERWLDIGCGRGAVLLPAAAGVGSDGTVEGTDISPAMVEATANLARERGLTQVTVRVDDAQDPVGVDTPFDTVSSCLVLFFLTDPAAALRAWQPLLVPGGRLGVTTFGPIDPRWHQVDDVFTPYLPPAMRDARTSGQQGPFSSDAAMEALVADAGYAEVRTVTSALSVRFADVEQWHAFTWSTGQRMMWLSVPEDERPAVRAEAERRVTEHAGPDGAVVFTQDIRHTLAVRPG